MNQKTDKNSYQLRLSPYHKIFYYAWKTNPSNYKYNLVFDQTLDNHLDISRLTEALYSFVDDYVLLNSHIQELSNELYWIRNSSINKLEIYPGIYTKQEIFNYVSNPFNLENGPLYRFILFKESDGRYRFIVVIHHILIDGTIFDSFITEISNYYNDIKHKTSDSIDRQIEEITLVTSELYKILSATTVENKLFWQNLLSNHDSIDLRFIKLDAISHVTEKRNNTTNEFRFSFDEKVCSKLETLKNKYKISPFLYGQMIFAILLFKYTAQEKLAICYPIEVVKSEKMIYGAKININFFTYSLDSRITILDLINQINNLKKNISKNCTCPINNIIENKDLFDVMFGQTNLKDMHFDFDNVKAELNTELNIDAPAKLLFEQEKIESKLNYRVRYDATEIDVSILNQFIMHYKELFITILNDLDQDITLKEIDSYSILNEAEVEKLIHTWNPYRKICPINKSIKQLFEEQVARTPDNIALVCEDRKLTYQELNEKTNQLSHYLKTNYNLKTDDLIALFLDRNEYMIMAILGVLKTGCAYVPMSPDFPKERIRYILKDTATKVTITNERHYLTFSDLIINNSYNTLFLDSEDFRKKLSAQVINNSELNPISNSLAYVIYTSGTTGTPKGVMVENQHVASFVINNNYIKLDFNNTVLSCSDYAFDGSVFDIFCSLLNGAKLIIADKKSILDNDSLKKIIIKNNIDTLFITTALFNQYIMLDNNPLRLLKNILFGGEKANTKILKNFIESNPDINLLHVYGPTENITFSTYCKLNKKNVEIAPIGKPLNDKTIYILDKNKKLLPIGAIGELYIGGVGVARGYLNLPELTQDKFIANPFQSKEEMDSNLNTYLYKTGDLVRFLPDGNLVYIGRNDFQIKIRGYRIELSEIEAKLLEYPEINEAVVLVYENELNKYLLAYYVSPYKLDEAAIQSYLKNILPKYMLPQILLHIEKLPLTATGKLNKDLLPSPIITNTDEFVLPRNLLETQLCALFSEILTIPVKDISIHHDFFTLGGNSINAIQLTTKLQRNFNIGVNDIYKLRTPAQIANFIPYTHTQDNLRNKLEQIKQIYTEVNKLSTKASAPEYTKIQFEQIPKNISTVLLTGATGHLGCHILYKLLLTTSYKIYLLVRSSKHDSDDINVYQRLNNTFSYYFNMGLEQFKNRIIILESDLTQPNLSLNEFDYQKLTTIDSIIHCAALVKHYGEYANFYQANVQATINLLELCKLTQFKDFHYISTIGIFFDDAIINNSSIFTEDDIDKITLNKGNFYTHYTQTKYIGEQVVIQYRQYGIKSNIYRVGNLAMNSENYKNQKNLEENAFFQRVKTILNFGFVPKELSEVEISPVDCVAEAIVKLFPQEKLANQIYHIFNPNTCDLYQLFSKYKNITVKRTSFDDFINTILRHLDNNNKQIELFMLHQGWLNEKVGINNQIKVAQNKTNSILSQLHFTWPTITSDMLSDIITQSFKE